jgi:NADPH:quinone reductase and related Zn-dependent oxidoreductases
MAQIVLDSLTEGTGPYTLDLGKLKNRPNSRLTGGIMHAIWMMKRGGTEVLKVREASDPQPGANEVRIRVKASGLNFADIMARLGLYPAAPKPPCVLGYEVSGTIDQIGHQVKEFSVGDRVVAMTPFGGHADAVCVNSNRVVKLTSEVSFEAAASLPINYLTAQQLLMRMANVQPGETILVHMAAGGVGLALLQLSQMIGGIHVIGTASASKHEIIRQNGCEYPIDYRNKDYVSEVRRITNGKGVDAVFDALGGVDWKRGYNLLRPSGRLLAYGFANLNNGGKRNLLRIARQLMSMPRVNPLKLMAKNRTVAGLTLSGLQAEPLMKDLKTLVEFCRTGTLKPVIDSRYPFSRVAEAHQRMEQRKNIGKILLTPD